MMLYVCLTLLLSTLHSCNGGLLQRREKRSEEERCGVDFTSGSRGEVKLYTTEFNGTGFYMYQPNEDCHWTINNQEDPDTYIMLTPVYFRLETSDNCIFDYLEITERGDHEETNKFCGWDPVTYISASNDLLIRFHSDESYEDKGFKFNFDIKEKALVGESKCNSTIYGPEEGDGEISSLDSTCFYNIRAGVGEVIELNLIELDFGDRSCEQENIQVFPGFGGQGKPLVTICKNASTGLIRIRESVFFIAYHKNGDFVSEGFKMAYTFVVDNFTPAPVPSTTPSPVGGNNDCSGLFIDPANGEMTYTAPKFEDNRKCIVVVRNTLLRNHVIEVKFTKFSLEPSENCMFDYLTIRAGEHEDSTLLGGKFGKLYCGNELKGRTLTTNGNSLRLEFKTDESYSFFGFKANIRFVPNRVCECEQRNRVCVRTGMEKLCVSGSACDLACQNGGKCVRNKGESRCVCRTGFSGADCSEGEGGLELLRFTIAPEDRELVRGRSSHHEECKAEVVGGHALITYTWTLDGETIGPYTSGRGFGTEPGGMLRFTRFTDQMEGTYSCIASTESDSSIEHFFEYKIIENCPAGIELGPKNKEMKVGENVFLECYAPTAVSVEWKKDGRLIDFDHQSRFTKTSNNYLYISQLEELDAGTYRCEARSQSGCYGYREADLTVLDVTPLNSYCGRTIYDEEPSSRISRGRKTSAAKYPWHVIFRGVMQENEEETFCGGSLISQKWVITAAHCVTEFKKKFNKDFDRHTVKMYIGALDCYGTGGIIRRPDEVKVHEHFKQDAYMDSDIALIELSSPVEFTDSIKPICLEPDTYNDKAFFGTMHMTFGKVAGCGENWRGEGSKSEDLEEISIPYVDRDRCWDMFEEQKRKVKVPINFQLTDHMICAGNDIRRTGDTCKGDSGGALVMVAQNHWVQTGIVSFGIGCDVGNYGVYTNVGKFYEWIRKHTGFDTEVIEN